jgi:hypothetical protein
MKGELKEVLEKQLLDILEEKYQNLYMRIYIKQYYLDWNNAQIEHSKKKKSQVSIYNSNTKELYGKIIFNLKMKKDKENKKPVPYGIVKSSLMVFFGKK